MTTSRLWLALVFVLFCLPLFVSLGHGDLRGDEAIYSFGVDRILETHEWMFPKSSPHEDAAFLEKPPLKFWIVAAPIRWGLLPHNEFGLRFWDAVFGSVACLYVFALGAKLAGPACGLIACLVLFTHRPLLFEHGLRSNNMEAALILSYCGGVFHYLAWAGAKRAPEAAVGSRATGAKHAVAAGLFFVLGFMTKFVAALFLPPVLLVATLVTPKWRTKFFHQWKVWALVIAFILVLCVPWFVVAHLKFGATLWQIMLGEHVYRRFANYLDPAHLNPWHYYVTQMYRELVGSQAALFVLSGLVFTVVQAWRKRSPELLLILLWLVIPTFLVSFGTSKLYHYAYPFLPPLGLAAGYLGAFMLAVLPLPLARALPRLTTRAHERLPGVAAAVGTPALRAVFLTVAAVAIVTAFTGLVYGPIRVGLPGGVEFRSSGVLRPALIAMVFGLLGGIGARAGQLLIPLIVASLLPLPGYGATLSRLDDEPDAMHTSVACVQRLRNENGTLPMGLYLDAPDDRLSHAMYYYFRRLRPWIRPPVPAPGQLGAYLSEPAELRPVVVSESTYQAFRGIHGSAAASRASLASTSVVTLDDDVLLLLPGPYAKCHAGGSGRFAVR